MRRNEGAWTAVLSIVVSFFFVVLAVGSSTLLRTLNSPSIETVCESPPVADTPPTTVDSVTAILAPQARDTTVLREIARLVVEEAARVRVDPLLVARIVRVENPWLVADTVSYAGAVGIMQIMPFHAGGYACAGSLTDARTSICLGVNIFRDYLETSLRAALLRYNGCTRAGCAGYADHVTEAL